MLMVVPRNVKFPRITDYAEYRQMRIFIRQKLSREMVADLTGGREKLLDNVVHEGTTRSRQMEKNKFISYEHPLSLLIFARKNRKRANGDVFLPIGSRGKTGWRPTPS
jgi:hypothetical protein